MSWSGRSASQDEVPVVAVVSEGSAAAAALEAPLEHFLSPTARRMAEMRGFQEIGGPVDTFKRRVLKKTGHFDNIPLNIDHHVKTMSFSAEENAWINAHVQSTPLQLGATFVVQPGGRPVKRFPSNEVQGDEREDMGVTWQWAMEVRPYPANTDMEGVAVDITATDPQDPPAVWMEVYRRRLAAHTRHPRYELEAKLNDDIPLFLFFNVLLDPSTARAMVLVYENIRLELAPLVPVIQEAVIRSYLYDTNETTIPGLSVSVRHDTQVRKILYKANAQEREIVRRDREKLSKK